MAKIKKQDLPKLGLPGAAGLTVALVLILAQVNPWIAILAGVAVAIAVGFGLTKK